MSSGRGGRRHGSGGSAARGAERVRRYEEHLTRDAVEAGLAVRADARVATRSGVARVRR